MAEKAGNSIFHGEEIEREDLEALRADNIGDTVYSAKWTLSVLQNLSQVEESGLSKETEDNLATLWDMTAEKGVARFLVEKGFLKVAEFILDRSQEPRLTEIIIGILGNLCCDPSILKHLGEQDELVSSILRLLSTDDPETLVQILRVLRAAVWEIARDEESAWTGKLKDSILREVLPFVLRSSTNEDLLVSTIGFLRSCLDVDSPTEVTSRSLLEDLVEPSRLLPGLIECFSELFPRETDLSSSRIEFLRDFLPILRSACACRYFSPKNSLRIQGVQLEGQKPESCEDKEEIGKRRKVDEAENELDEGEDEDELDEGEEDEFRRRRKMDEAENELDEDELNEEEKEEFRRRRRKVDEAENELEEERNERNVGKDKVKEDEDELNEEEKEEFERGSNIVDVEENELEEERNERNVERSRLNGEEEEEENELNEKGESKLNEGENVVQSNRKNTEESIENREEVKKIEKSKNEDENEEKNMENEEENEEKTLQGVFDAISRILRDLEDFSGEKFDSATTTCFQECAEMIFEFRDRGFKTENLDSRIFKILGK